MTDSQAPPVSPAPAARRSPRAQLLSNGNLTTLFTEAGSGYTAYAGYALTRWVPDRVRDADGAFLYVRDLESGEIWSAGQQPVPHESCYRSQFEPGCAGVVRVIGKLEIVTEVCVAPDHDAEFRRYTLTNRGKRALTLELTTYAEVALATPLADASHPAFAKLFVQTEFLPESGALLAKRRLRNPEDDPLWIVHLLVSGAGGELHYETDRARFIGRGRTLAAPRALDNGAGLSGTVGSVLDPILSLRRVVRVEPAASAQVVAVLGAGSTRSAVEAVAARHSASGMNGDLVAAFAGAKIRARRLLAEFSVPGEWVGRLPSLTGTLLYPDRSYCEENDTQPALLDFAALRAHGLSRNHPLVLVEVSSDETIALAKVMAGIVAYWRRSGVAVDLLTLADVEAGAAEDLERELAALGSGTEYGTTLVRRLADVSPEVIETARGVARMALRGDPMPEVDQITESDGPAAHFRRAGVESLAHQAQDQEPEKLHFFNGYGGFSADGSEYVIRVACDGSGHLLPPLPWVNVVANERFGFVVSERGSSSTWSLNSRENRLTPWSNDPVMDPHGEALYIRDEERGVFWSPTPGPAPAPAAYEVRHGFGYTRWRHASMGIGHEVTHFVPRLDPVKIVRLRLTNRGDDARRLSVFSFAHWVLGGLPHESGRFIVTRFDPASGTIFAMNPGGAEFAGRVAFAAAIPEAPSDMSASGDREGFLGVHGTMENPAALRSAEPLDEHFGAGLDPCAAFQLSVSLAPGADANFIFLLGEADSLEDAHALVRRYGEPGAADGALTDVRAFWTDLTGRVRIETPSLPLDLMVNGWLGYQNLSCRMWARTALYQSGGAFGFRDQLQDSTALLYYDPDFTRRQIILHAAHQFVEGDVLHWWHPPASKGIRTKFSDDLLWLPYVVAFYVESTGDRSVLDENARFVAARELAPDEDEAFLLPAASATRATIYEHCCLAIDRSLTAGAHGLPLMGSGDWNDGMNRVGREGRGESVWLGFFLAGILADFIPLCERRGDGARAKRYRVYRVRLVEALDDAGWDGEWYRRAYYDDGTPLGSAQSDECRIDAIAQAWSVLSRVASRERAASALDAMERYLVSESDGLIRLLSPPFDRTPHDPGYIKGYIPGIRENGGQYTHAALWAVRSLAEFGRRDRAARLLEMLSPVSRTRTPGGVAVYQAEPYVVAADVYGVAPHVGRGGWTWYTGSAGWMFRVTLESILGLRIRGGEQLILQPCIPDDWPGFKLRYALSSDGPVYEFTVTRASSGPTVASLDGEELAVESGAVVVPIAADGAVHRVDVFLGPDAAPFYTQQPS